MVCGSQLAWCSGLGEEGELTAAVLLVACVLLLGCVVMHLGLMTCAFDLHVSWGPRVSDILMCFGGVDV